MKRSLIAIAALLLTSLLALPHASAIESSGAGTSSGGIYIAVGQARVKKSLMAFPETKAMSVAAGQSEGKSFMKQVREIVTRDLDFTSLFTWQSSAAFIEKPEAGLSLESFRISDWTTIGTEFLLKTGLALTGGDVVLEVRLYDVLGTKQIMGKRYVAKSSEPKILAHTVANDLMTALTGRPGIFFSKLAMVCDKTGTKEIWITDFDGSNPKQLTAHNTLAFAPAWSPDNRKIAYSLFTKNRKNIKNIDLYEFDIASNRSTLLSNRKGINSGAAYSPDGKGIALTMSFLGNPEIFFLDPITKDVTRLTKSIGFDVDPAFSPDGKHIAFVSSRSNQPMVFSASVEQLKQNPSAAKRLTFAGKYNATPTWAPRGDKIVFAGYIESHFDLFMMGLDGGNLERLTKDEGNNEDPHFSSDGNFVAFSSNRGGQKNIYVITADGMSTRRITYGLGNCTAPKWSNFSKVPF